MPLQVDSINPARNRDDSSCDRSFPVAHHNRTSCDQGRAEIGLYQALTVIVDTVVLEKRTVCRIRRVEEVKPARIQKLPVPVKKQPDNIAGGIEEHQVIDPEILESQVVEVFVVEAGILAAHIAVGFVPGRPVAGN